MHGSSWLWLWVPMASSIVRSPLNPISQHVTCKPSPSDHRSRTTTAAAVTIHRPYSKQRRRRNVPVLACSLQSHNADDNHNVVGGRSKTELQRIADDSPNDDVSKDPNNNTNMLPSINHFYGFQFIVLLVIIFLILGLILTGPLSSTQSSNSVSHLRVAYQVSVYIYIYIYIYLGFQCVCSIVCVRLCEIEREMIGL